MFILRKTTRLVCGLRYYQNYVWSEAFSRLQRQCGVVCPVPQPPLQKVCVCGAGSDIGRIVALILKQQSLVRHLALYDEAPPGAEDVMGVACDVAHIDTSAQVQAYRGRTNIRHALNQADVVVVCGGFYPLPPSYNTHEHDLFTYNEQLVRAYVTACAAFCPNAFIAIQTPPVDANFTLAAHTLQMLNAYDPRKLFGVNEVNAMRAQALVSAEAKKDPAKGYTPVVLGTCRNTRVPVWSGAGKIASKLRRERLLFLTRVVRDADDIISRVKCNDEQGHLSIGFATARFVVNLLRGLVEKPTLLPSALVEQLQPGATFNLQYCSTPVVVGPCGIQEVMVPKLGRDEKDMFECSLPYFLDMLELGRCYARGEEFYPCYCHYKGPPVEPCPAKTPEIACLLPTC